jgi:hypothetical protein
MRRGRMAGMDPQLQQIIELQTEQNQLLRKYLWRIRFSLLTLLVLTTVICCGLGLVVYRQQGPAPAAPPVIPPVPPYGSPAPPSVAPYYGPQPAPSTDEPLIPPSTAPPAEQK